jgi:hypothetical protein
MVSGVDCRHQTYVYRITIQSTHSPNRAVALLWSVLPWTDRRLLLRDRIPMTAWAVSMSVFTFLRGKRSVAPSKRPYEVPKRFIVSECIMNEGGRNKMA